ncbi:hypothetical protein [Convivina intestini]|uniref:Uncharacterized protein n=1 Tax=Convivina intestini TaxID=1505726 RepID=A0A2U1DCC4_9LACO|nr:hypothetical protein [Convivina intestini]PVY85249.1 hypothetical protein C7384_10267 [Convivina intestini]CAH1852593.1 hypothetical protein R077811_00467 [Convivina intestini]SDB87205.1 hypothetical protein SAMN05216341_102192 [Leuconostocaceae bacterium R-53105]
MTENLPDQLKSLWDQGLAANRQDDWAKAALIWSELYESLNTFEVNYRLVVALFMNEQYRLAFDIAADYLDDYLVDDDLQQLLISLAVQNQEFVYAQQLALLVTDEKQQQELVSEIRAAEDDAQETMGTTFQTVARHFYHLSDYDLISQEQRYQEAYQLPVKLFQAGARYLLLDPFCSPVMRASLLVDLKKLGLEETVSYYWIDDEKYEVNLEQVNLPLDSQAYQAVKAVLHEQMANQDPIAFQTLLEQVRLEVSMLFPKITASITDPKAWAQADIQHYQQQQSSLESASQAQIHQKVNQLLDQLFT